MATHQAGFPAPLQWESLRAAPHSWRWPPQASYHCVLPEHCPADQACLYLHSACREALTMIRCVSTPQVSQGLPAWKNVSSHLA